MLQIPVPSPFTKRQKTVQSKKFRSAVIHMSTRGQKTEVLSYCSIQNSSAVSWKKKKRKKKVKKKGQVHQFLNIIFFILFIGKKFKNLIIIYCHPKDTI